MSSELKMSRNSEGITMNLVVSVGRNTVQYDWLHGGGVSEPGLGDEQSADHMAPV